MYGWYYDTAHIHACTANAGEGNIRWKVEGQVIAFRRNPLDVRFSDSSAWMTTNWCDVDGSRWSHTAGASDDWWAYKGNNYFKLQTLTERMYGDERCFNEVTDFNLTSSFDQRDADTSVAGSYCDYV